MTKALIVFVAVLSLSSLDLFAAEADLNIATCFTYMMQTHRHDGAKVVARKVTDLDAVQHYFISALRSKVNPADGNVACLKIGVDPKNYRILTTQKDD